MSTVFAAPTYGLVLSAGGVTAAPTYALFANPAALTAAPTYGLVTLAGGVSAAPTYALFANPSAVTAAPTYAILSNPASVIAAPTYAIFAPFYPPYIDQVLIYDFVEEQFPVCVSFGSSGGPGFRTSVYEFDSGYTSCHIEWERLRARYNVTFENATPADIAELEDFFYGVKGRAIAFRYKDWQDYQIANQNVLVGDGQTDRFQMFKRYTSGSHVYDRPIKKPVLGTVSLELDSIAQVEGTDFAVNYTTGEIVFAVAPAANSVGTLVYAEYDVPVRFDTDELSVTYDDFRQLGVGSLPLIEILT